MHGPPGVLYAAVFDLHTLLGLLHSLIVSFPRPLASTWVSTQTNTDQDVLNIKRPVHKARFKLDTQMGAGAGGGGG